MKKSILATVVAAMPTMMFAQSAVDLYQTSQTELRGTARFMSMAGAFGALGGDMSTMRQNPAGIGVYRRSEVGVTLDVDIQNSKFSSLGESATNRQTKAACDNFGYIGSVRLDSDIMPFFTWGASYGRTVSFDRVYKGMIPSLSNSLSNYIAANVANGFTADELNGKYVDGNGQVSSYNPYYESDVPWLGALGYASFMVDPTQPGATTYDGLFQNGSFGDASINVRERGYVDEYNISFGGNFVNTVYWGLSFGITDMNFTRESYYDEQIGHARIMLDDGQRVDGGSYNGLSNYFNVNGSGFNCKFGLIFKPVNEFRLGFAIHTPTWYNLTYNVAAAADYANWIGDAEDPFRTNIDGYRIPEADFDNNPNLEVSGYYDRKMRTPWRMIVSAAGVIGGRGILSMDYEYEAYKDMRVSDSYGQFDDVTMDVKNYYRPTNTIRVGAEFRVTPQFSLRAGYSYKSSPAQETAYNNQQYIYTAGTNPMYMFDSSIQYVTCGLGYSTGGFSIDAAYVHKHRESSWSAFSSYDGLASPSGTITDNNNHIVLSLGYKF